MDEEMKKIIQKQQELFDSLKNMIPALEKIEENLKKVNDMTGATQRANDIRNEISTRGWDIVSKIRNPEVNQEDPAAVPLWEFYKYIYEDMKRKGEINE
jgi:hypothetical protein